MIVLFLEGGLGNQIFQYSAAKTLSELRMKDKIVIDIDQYIGSESRKFELRKFRLSNVHIATKKEKSKLSYRVVKAIIRRYKKFATRDSKFFARYNRLVQAALSKAGIYIDVGGDEITPNSFHFLRKGNIYLYGYFQYPWLVQSFSRLDLKVMSPELECWKQNNMIGEHVCVHVRLGDYVNNSYYGICTKSYYYKAMEYLASKISDPVFHVFSDDLQRVKHEFKFDFPIVFEEERNSSVCLMKMSLCRHFILSNSTFSWWAQKLSLNKNKIVVAPSYWYGDKQRRFYLYDNAWELIEP